MATSRFLPPASSAPNQPTAPTSALRLLRFPDVRARTGLSRSTIWRLERSGAFPSHRRISTNAVAWLEQDVTDWIQTKLATTA